MKHPSMVRVAPISSDASKDYWITYEDAQIKLSSGELVLDATNSESGKPVYIPAETK